MVELYIIRHGETDWNSVGRLQGQVDIELNEVGLQQAYECANALSSVNFDAVYSSSLKRAFTTASIIEETIHVPITIDDDFIEMFFGEAEGLLIAEREELYGESKDYPGMESVEDFRNRINRGLQKIVRDHNDETVLLVAHGKVINEILESISRGELETGKIGIVNGSITILNYADKQWVIKDFNKIDHLSSYSEIGKI